MIEAQAQAFNTVTGRAHRDLPPACANPGEDYRLAMGDWLIASIDAAGGGIRGVSTYISQGYGYLTEISTFKHLVPEVAIHATAPPAQGACKVMIV